jgi:hypothetical protein
MVRYVYNQQIDPITVKVVAGPDDPYAPPGRDVLNRSRPLIVPQCDRLWKVPWSWRFSGFSASLWSAVSDGNSGQAIKRSGKDMRIFLSHRSRDKALIREFKGLLPGFLDAWLDEESLSWGESFPAELKTTIQSGVDFLIIFLDNDAVKSKWVVQELEWAIQRERELKRTFVLPILRGCPVRS